MTATGGHRGSAPTWIASCLWVLVLGGFLIHLVPGFGFASAIRGGPSQYFILIVFALFLLSFASVGALVASRLPRNPIGWMLLGAALGYVLGGIASSNMAVPHGYAVALNLATQPLYNVGLALGLMTLLLFPTGSYASRRWRWVGWLIGSGWLLSAIGQTFGPARLPDLHSANPLAAGGALGHALNALQEAVLLTIVGGVLAGISLVVRFRKSDGLARKQIEWLAYAALIVVLAIVASTVLMSVPQSDALTNYVNGIISAALACVPIAMGIAILRRRLYDIDVIFNKTVVFGLLVAFITVVYIVIVVGIGALIGQHNNANLGLSIAATAIVAVAFQPVRERVQRLANRLVYGKRATPYEALAAFSDQLGAAVVSEGLPRQLATVLAEATGAVRTQVWLRAGDLLRLEAADPADDQTDPERPRETVTLPPDGLPAFPGATMAFEVRHRGERLGALTLTKRAGEALTPTESKLAGQLAAQAGLALRNAGLTRQLTDRMAELRASRKRIVAAADNERRRLERNIHDGAQQQLVALSVMVRLAETTVDTDLEATKGLVSDVQADAREAAENLRDLARGVYPRLLADLGLAAALRAQASKAPIPVTVHDNGGGRYPQDAEAAVYFCVLEALQNVAKYAGASRATVRLDTAEGELEFSVTDDGAGFDAGSAGNGTGLQGMADRLAAFGGALEIRSEPGAGTTVNGRLPVRALEQVP